MPEVDIIRIKDNPHETESGIRVDTNSRGVDLAGAKITAIYADGSTESLIWSAFDPYTSGGANGENITMSFGFDWHNLSTTKLLTSLQIDLQPASSVFDTTSDNDDDPEGMSTPGSLIGYPFRLAPEYEELAGSLTVSYSGIVNLEGSPAVGDLYTTMTVDFSKLSAGGILGDFRWNSDIDTMEISGDLKPSGAPCLVRGTLVATDQGDMLVENLTPGCMVLTQDNGFQELVLIISRAFGLNELRMNKKLYPIRITAGALCPGLPRRDLIVSRQHRVVVRSDIAMRMLGSSTALVAALQLTEMPGVFVDDSIESVEYFHLVFERHEVIFAEGAPTESFLISNEGQRTLTKDQRKKFAALFPKAEEVGYMCTPRHFIPSGKIQRKLIRRHVKNEKDIINIALI